MDILTDNEDTEVLDDQEQQEQQPTPKLTVKVFAAKIKAKYPEYKDVDDNELTQKIVAKYPEYKSQVDLEVKKKEPIPSRSPSSAIPLPSPSQSQKESLAELIKPQEIPAGQRMNEPVSTAIPSKSDQLKQAQEIEDAPKRATLKKERTDKLVDLTAKKVLESKGIKIPSNKSLDIGEFSKLDEEKKRVEEDLATGKVAMVFDKKANDYVLKRTTGFLDSFVNGWNRSNKASDEAHDFMNNMDSKQRVEYLKKQEETEKESFPYSGTIPNKEAGSLGDFAGENAPIVAKGALGATAGTMLSMAAPVTGGLTLAGLPAATAFIFTAPDIVNQSAKQAVIEGYYKNKKEHPDWSDEKAMEEADQRKWAGGSKGLIDATVLGATGGNILKAPINQAGKNVFGDVLRGTINSGVKMGATSGATEALKEAEGNLEGYHSSPSEIYDKTIEAAKEGFTVGAALHLTVMGVEKAAGLPPLLYNAAKKALVENAPISEISKSLEANEKAGNVPEGTTEKVTNDLEGYKAALDEVPKDLPEEAKSAIAGLIQKKENASPEEVKTIDSQIEKITETGKTEGVEFDNLTGEKYGETTEGTGETVQPIEPEQKGQGIETSVSEQNPGTRQGNAETIPPILEENPLNEKAENEIQQPTTGGGSKEPPKVTPIEEDGKGEDWTAIRKEKQREIKAVKDAYEKQGVKGWSETMRIGLEKTQKAHPEKPLYDAALTTMHQIKAGLGHGDLTTDEALATMQYLKRELGAKRSQLAEAVTSDNELQRQAALIQDEALAKDYENAALAIKDITTTAGRTLNYAQSELRLDSEHGLQIRRMQLLRAKGGEKLTPEEMKWTKEKWDQERNIMEQEAKVREQSMKEDFDNRISELQKQYEEKLKEASKNTPANRAKKEKTLSQKGKDIADQIRKLKTNKNDLNLDITFGLRNLAIEGVAQLVEKGSTVAEAIKEVLKDVKFKGITENELTAHIVDGLTNKKDKAEQLSKIEEFAKKNNETDITNEMVTNNIIRDYVNSHVGEVEKSKVFDTAFEDLKKVLPDVTKEKLTEAYLKEGEFKQPTKKQLEGGIREQENELKRIAKSELTADQQQKLKLDAEKKNVVKKIKEFKRKLADGEFEEPVPVKLKKADAELIRLKKQQSVIEEAYRKEQKKFQEQNKSRTERLADFARSLYVAILIGAPKTLAKVASMSVMRPFSEATTKLTFGKIFDRLFPNISKAALRGGESSSISSIQKGFEAYFKQMGNQKMESLYDKANEQYESARKSYNDYKDSNNPDPAKLEKLKNDMNQKLIKVQGSFIYKFIGGSSLKDALSSLVNRSNEIEKQFGKVEGESIKDGNWLDKTNYIMGFIGRSHSAAKTFSGRFSFAAGFMARLEGAVRNGEDISKPDKVLEIAHESYLDWERGKYQQSNQISDLWNKLTNHISEGEKGTPREGTAKAMAALLKTEVAITRVPVNILHEAVMEYTLGAFRAVAMAAKNNMEVRKQLKGEGIPVDKPEFKEALKERISQMDEKQAATIARAFRKGGLGVGLYALALMSGAVHFGIFPHLGQKKKKEEEDLKPDELNPGQVMVGNNKYGEVASGIIEHIPALWPTFMGLGMAQAYKDEIDKGKTSNEAAQQAIMTHLKVVEGSIPQSKIISPSRVASTIMQTVKKKAIDSGLIEKEDKSILGENSELNKLLTEKGITPPTFGLIKQHKIDVDYNHPNRANKGDEPYSYMTDDEFKKFNEIRKEFFEKEVDKMLKTKYSVDEETPSGNTVSSKMVLGKDLDKKQLEGKIQDIKGKASEYAKEKMGLVKPKNKTTVEEF